MSGALLSAVLLLFFFFFSAEQKSPYGVEKAPPNAAALGSEAPFAGENKARYWRTLLQLKDKPLRSAPTAEFGYACYSSKMADSHFYIAKVLNGHKSVSYTKITIITPRKVRATEYIRERF